MKRSAPLERKVPLRAKGGFARAGSLTPERRSEIARADGLALQAQRVASRNASAVHVEHRAVMATNLGAEPPIAAPKDGTFRSEAWLRAVRTLPCVFCGAPAEAAHRNKGKAMAMKTDDSLTASLCRDHHREIDHGKDMTRQQRHARMDEAIVLTLRELVRSGMVRVRA